MWHESCTGSRYPEQEWYQYMNRVIDDLPFCLERTASSLQTEIQSEKYIALYHIISDKAAKILVSWTYQTDQPDIGFLHEQLTLIF